MRKVIAWMAIGALGASGQRLIEPVTRSAWVSVSSTANLTFANSGSFTEANIVGKCVRVRIFGEAVVGGFNIGTIELIELKCTKRQLDSQLASTSQIKQLYKDAKPIEQLCLKRGHGFLDVGCIAKIRMYPKTPFPKDFVGSWKLKGSKIVLRSDGVDILSECNLEQMISLVVVFPNGSKTHEHTSTLLTAQGLNPPDPNVVCGENSLTGLGKWSDWQIKKVGKRLRIVVRGTTFYLHK
jgi:hypothetical protein